MADTLLHHLLQGERLKGINNSLNQWLVTEKKRLKKTETLTDLNNIIKKPAIFLPALTNL